jgi:solute carrier family 35 (UDP-galactose transporter), member B1
MKGSIPAILPPLLIYPSFLYFISCHVANSCRLWAMLQEKISTTPYGPDRIIFRSTLVLNTVQSLIAAVVASFYIRTSGQKQQIQSTFSNGLLWRYLLLAIASSTGSWFGYRSLRWVDYPTMVLGKSSKLLPVMFLHLVLYRRRFPGYKYLVVGMVTAGVGIFTLFHPVEGSKKAASNSIWGLSLLSINLLADGFVNSTQDQIFSGNQGLTGPQMMLGFNVCSTILTTVYLIATYLIPSATNSEISNVVQFVRLHPRVLMDILAFAISGAVGQIFIFLTLSMHGSLILVTITVTRKLFTMLLSVVWFNHSLTKEQWLGVGLVFSGIGLEAYWTRKAKLLTKQQIEIAQKTQKSQ